MTAESVLVRRQADLVGEGLEAWKAETDRAEAVARLEVFAALLAATGGWMCAARDREWRELFGGARDYPHQQRGLELRDTYESALRVFEGVEKEVAIAEAEGHVVASAEAFRAAHQEVKELQADFLRRWPLFTVEQIEKGRAQIARGEFLTGEEIRRELASGRRPSRRGLD